MNDHGTRPLPDAPLSVFVMARDPRLRLLFRHVGTAVAEGLYDGFVDDRTIEALYDSLLDLAPEYLPPDDPENEQDMREWHGFLNMSTRSSEQPLHGSEDTP